MAARRRTTPLAHPTSSLRELLAGGDRRSVRGANRVLAELKAAPERITELVQLTRDADWLVVMRALDVFEKLARANPSLVQRHKRVLIGPLSDHEQWEVRLQIVRALPLLEWTPAERERAITILRRDVQHPQTFVRAWALDGLASFAESSAALRAEVERELTRIERSGKRALAARARQIRARLAGAPRRPRSPK